MDPARPELTTDLDGKTFTQWYWLKEELVSFCRAQGIPASGSKEELTKMIAGFLDTREASVVSKPARKSKPVQVSDLALDTLIEENFVCSEKHRAFFKDKIGPSFSFNVAFQKWLKANAGKTYADAVRAYYEILEERKSGRKNIDRQFEYNTYVRDFFEHNKGRSLDDAIRCWKYKKSLPGHNRYEDSDLAALGE
ncbi:MAG: hypothetical protein J6X33_01155 [Clostridiales bacterium]|nr:hypothetical protein [Clostridiales bacterium]